VIIGLNAGFGDPLGADLDAIAGQGYTGIRQDVQPVTDPVVLQARIDELRGSAVAPLFIVRGAQLDFLQPGETAELLNEPNLSFPDRPSLTPEDYAVEWNTYAPAALDRGVIVYFGSISNLTKDPLQWLAAALAHVTVAPTHIAFHRYPPESGDFFDAHRGFRRRKDELDALTQAVARTVGGDVTYACTEFGYHQGERRKWWGFGPAFRLTDEEVADALRLEWQYLAAWGCVRADLYQLNDGPDDSWINQFGIRRTDGTWKPAATAHAT